MQRSPQAYLLDILDACDSVESLLRGIDLDSYENSRAIRSAVEREFIIIGEAVGLLGRAAPEVFARITDAPVIVGFRNVLAHEYAAVDNEAVLGVAEHSLPLLRDECQQLLEEFAGAD